MKKLGQRGRSDKSEFFSVVAGGDNQMFSWRELEKLHQRKGRLKRQKRTENEREIDTSPTTTTPSRRRE